MVVRRLLWMVSKEGASAATRATELAAAVGRGGESKAGDLAAAASVPGAPALGDAGGAARQLLLQRSRTLNFNHGGVADGRGAVVVDEEMRMRSLVTLEKLVLPGADEVGMARGWHQALTGSDEMALGGGIVGPGAANPAMLATPSAPGFNPMGAGDEGKNGGGVGGGAGEGGMPGGVSQCLGLLVLNDLSERQRGLMVVVAIMAASRACSEVLWRQIQMDADIRAAITLLTHSDSGAVEEKACQAVRQLSELGAFQPVDMVQGNMVAPLVILLGHSGPKQSCALSCVVRLAAAPEAHDALFTAGLARIAPSLLNSPFAATRRDALRSLTLLGNSDLAAARVWKDVVELQEGLRLVAQVIHALGTALQAASQQGGAVGEAAASSVAHLIASVPNRAMRDPNVYSTLSKTILQPLVQLLKDRVEFMGKGAAASAATAVAGNAIGWEVRTLNQLIQRSNTTADEGKDGEEGGGNGGNGGKKQKTRGPLAAAVVRMGAIEPVVRLLAEPATIHDRGRLQAQKEGTALLRALADADAGAVGRVLTSGDGLKVREPCCVLCSCVLV